MYLRTEKYTYKTPTEIKIITPNIKSERIDS